MSKRKLATVESPTQSEILEAFPEFVHARGEFEPERIMSDPPYAEFMPGAGEMNFNDGEVVAIYQRVEVYRVTKTVTVKKSTIKLGGGR
jgi:hypothetical protein